MKWLRENISLFNGVALLVLFFVTLGRGVGVSETKITNIETKLSSIETKQQTSVDQGTATAITLANIQSDVKGLTDDVADGKVKDAAQDKRLDDHDRGLDDLGRRVGVIENRSNRR